MPRVKKQVAANRRAGAAAGESIKTAHSTHGDSRGAGLPPALQQQLRGRGFAPLPPIKRQTARAMARLAHRLVARLGGHGSGNSVDATRSQRAFIIVDSEYFQQVEAEDRAGLIDEGTFNSRDCKVLKAFKLGVAKAAAWTATERTVLKRLVVELKLQLAGAAAGEMHVDAGGAPRAAVLVALQDGTPATLFATAASLACAGSRAPRATTWYDRACAAKSLGVLEEAPASPPQTVGDANYIMVDYPHRSPAAGSQTRLISYCFWNSENSRLTSNLGDPKFVLARMPRRPS